MVKRVPTSGEIIDAASEVSGVPVCEMMGYNSCPEYRRARVAACVVLRELRGMSYLEMAKRFNRRQHSTVYTWLSKQRDAEAESLISRIKEQLTSEVGSNGN